MKNIFVFCAGERKARENYRNTVLKPIPEESVLPCFPVESQAELRAWQEDAGGFFAWGIREGQRTMTMLRNLAPGDCVLAYFDFHYQSVSRLIGKTQSSVFAEKMWGGSSWVNVIFITRPREVKVSALALQPYLCSTYRGATRIAADRIKVIIRDFGSVEAFIAKSFPN